MSHITSSRRSVFLFNSSRWMASLGVAFFGLTAISSASAQVLLTIDDSNPSAVVFTATGLNPSANYNGGNTANLGIDLLQFFTVDQELMAPGQFLSGTLTGGNIGVNYNDAWSDSQSTSGVGFFDLELYVDVASPGESTAETFSTTQPAFSGTWTIDMSSLLTTTTALPALGTTGIINTGVNGNPGANIGQWEVQAVPEPGTTGLAVFGFAVSGFAVFRQRRRARR